jgi:antitoxin VapB
MGCASICSGIGRSSGWEDAVQNERIVRLFRNGRNQAVRIPRDLELPGSEALLRKEGDRLIVEPMARPSLLELLSSWAPLDEEFPEIDDLEPIEDVNL